VTGPGAVLDGGPDGGLDGVHLGLQRQACLGLTTAALPEVGVALTPPP